MKRLWLGLLILVLLLAGSILIQMLLYKVRSEEHTSELQSP